MKKTDLNRRDFNRLSMAAFGGVVAGSLAGCGGGDDEAEGPTTDPVESLPEIPSPETPDDTSSETTEAENDVANLLGDNHVCRGLNTCENKGAGGANACAGQGACAIAEAHDCHTLNQCKGQGGCGDYPGQNACQGQGACHVPLGEDAWAKARAAFEAAMTEAGNAFGDAPAAAEG